MNARLLVTSAGSGASGNLVRSLRAGNAALVIVGCHDDQFILKNSTADRNYLVPPLSHPTWARSVRRVMDAERSEERRVGKECPQLCRSRWSPYH